MDSAQWSDGYLDTPMKPDRVCQQIMRTYLIPNIKVVPYFGQ